MGDPREEEIAEAVVRLATARGADRSLCPSDVARALAGTDRDWRRLMPLIHAVVERLARDGRVSISKAGRPVGIGRPRGAYRVRLPAPPSTGAPEVS